MRIISRTPELHNNSSPPFIAWRTVISEFVAQQLGADVTDLTPRVAASCIQAATMSALIWWGTRSDSEPADAVDLALRQLEAGFAQPASPSQKTVE